MMVTHLTTTVSKLQDKVDSLEKAFTNQQYKMACDSIKDLIARGTLSLDEVKSILKEWGFDLNNQKVRKRIASSITPWTEEKHVIVPLKDVEYYDPSISISLNGKKLNIPARLLPFETSVILEDIKDILAGNLEAFIDKKFRFKPGSASNPLTIEGEYVLRKIKVDSASLQIFKKIEELKKKQGPFKANIVITGIFGLCNPQNIKGKGAIPTKFLLRKKYPRKCAEILMDTANICHITDKDLWFKVGDILIWEEPKYSKATYIFNWPEEPLKTFIFRVWISELKDIRKDPESGYIDRVNHVPDVDSWEKNLKTKIQNVGINFVLGKFTIP